MEIRKPQFSGAPESIQDSELKSKLESTQQSDAKPVGFAQNNTLERAFEPDPFWGEQIGGGVIPAPDTGVPTGSDGAVPGLPKPPHLQKLSSFDAPNPDALAMKEAGYSPREIADALLGRGYSQAEVLEQLRRLGFSGPQAALAMFPTIFEDTIPAPNCFEDGGLMKEGGYGATEIAKGLTVLGFSMDDIRRTLESLGFDEIQIQRALWESSTGEY